MLNPRSLCRNLMPCYMEHMHNMCYIMALYVNALDCIWETQGLPFKKFPCISSMSLMVRVHSSLVSVSGVTIYNVSPYLSSDESINLNARGSSGIMSSNAMLFTCYQVKIYCNQSIQKTIWLPNQQWVDSYWPLSEVCIKWPTDTDEFWSDLAFGHLMTLGTSATHPPWKSSHSATDG